MAISFVSFLSSESMIAKTLHRFWSGRAMSYLYHLIPEPPPPSKKEIEDLYQKLLQLQESKKPKGNFAHRLSSLTATWWTSISPVNKTSSNNKKIDYSGIYKVSYLGLEKFATVRTIEGNNLSIAGLTDKSYILTPTKETHIFTHSKHNVKVQFLIKDDTIAGAQISGTSYWVPFSIFAPRLDPNSKSC